MKRYSRLRLVLVGLSLCACASTESGVPTGDPGRSLTGAGYPPLRLEPDVLASREAELEAARSRLAAYPGDRDAWIWVGRRLGYLGRFEEAIDVYGAALLRFPDDPRLLRHRGHRYLTVRALEAARADLEAAAKRIALVPDEIELDGLPNPRNEPRSTLHGNVWYHLALTRYLQGEFAPAREAWERALAIATNEDAWVAAAYWTVLARLRSGGDSAALLAEVQPEMDVIENRGYFGLLLAFRGDVEGGALLAGAPPGSVERTTIAYGLAAWDLAHGREEQGLAACRRIASDPNWHAFGHLAAEAELARRSD